MNINSYLKSSYVKTIVPLRIKVAESSFPGEYVLDAHFWLVFNQPYSDFDSCMNEVLGRVLDGPDWSIKI